MGIQVAACLLISQNVLIDPLMTNSYLLAFFKPSRNLFRTPILAQFLFYHFPGLCRNPFHGCGVPSSFAGFFICLFRTIASFTRISAQFSANCRFMYLKFFGYFCRAVLHSLQCRNLVSLFRGKLFVGSHRTPLTWRSKEGYPTSAYLFRRPSKLHFGLESTTYKLCLFCLKIQKNFSE